jgi:hypothetical protein
MWECTNLPMVKLEMVGAKNFSPRFGFDTDSEGGVIADLQIDTIAKIHSPRFQPWDNECRIVDRGRSMFLTITLPSPPE